MGVKCWTVLGVTVGLPFLAVAYWIVPCSKVGHGFCFWSCKLKKKKDFLKSSLALSQPVTFATKRWVTTEGKHLFYVPLRA